MPKVEKLDVGHIIEYQAIYEILNRDYKRYVEMLETLRELANKSINSLEG